MVPLYKKCKLAKIQKIEKYSKPHEFENFNDWFFTMVTFNIPHNRLREEILHQIPSRKSKELSKFLYPFFYLSHLLKGKPSDTEIIRYNDGSVDILKDLSAEEIKLGVFSLMKSKDDFTKFKKTVEIINSAVGRLLDEQMAKKVDGNS